MVWTAVKELHRYINEFMRQTSLAYTVPAISHDLCMDESSRFNFFFGTVLNHYENKNIELFLPIMCAQAGNL